MKKIGIILSLLLFFSSNGVTYAQGIDMAEDRLKVNLEKVYPMGEETKWVYKNIDGHRYKRLWSISAQEWLSPWIKIS